MSFNFEALALDVEACYIGIGSNIVGIYEYLKKIKNPSTFQLPMQNDIHTF
jgi:hypothetical protein